MSTFKKYKLGELYNVSSGLSKPRGEFGFGHPFVTFKDVFYNFFLPDKLRELANTTEKEIKSCSIKQGDIFLTRTSETMEELGMSSVALRDYPNTTFNGFTKRLRLKEAISIKIDPVFIGYYMRSQEIRNQVFMHSSMTTRASLNSSAINSIEICIPELPHQKRIGKILKSLDDKIELNRRTNHTLEQIGQTLFKKYFVDDIDPENLPEGWRWEKLREHIEVKNGFAFKGADFIENGVPVLKIKNVKAGKILLDNLSYVSKTVAKSCAKYMIKKNDLLITMTGNRMDGGPDSWVGKAAMFYKDGEYLLNQRISKIETVNDNLISKYYLCQLFTTEDFQYYFVSHATSSGGQANISPDLIYDTEVLIPSHNVMAMFNESVKRIYDKMFANEVENENLSLIRDSLLPKLMSGEIEVNTTEQELTVP